MISKIDGLHFFVELLIAALFCLAMKPAEGIGQSVSSELTFKNISINDGLSQNSVRAIVQDRDGFIWIGTKSGLNRYDGFSFETFFNDPFDSTSISGNDIISMHVDRDNVLWIATTTGLNRYDRSNGSFARIEFPTCDHVKFPDHIAEIQEDKLGRLWLAHVEGGVSIISKDGQLISTQSTICQNDFFQNEIYCFYTDKDLMWVGTEKGLLKINSQDWSQQYFPVVAEIKNSIDPNRNDMVSAISPSAQLDQLWLGKVGSVALFDKNSGEYTLFQDSIMEASEFENSIDQIVYDENLNRLWLSGIQGFTSFDIGNKQFIRHPVAIVKQSGLASGTNLTVLKSDDGCIWLGTNGYGIDLYSPAKNKFNELSCDTCKHEYTGTYGLSARTIFEDREGIIWFSAGVLYKWNRGTNALKSFGQVDLPFSEFGNVQVWSMSQDAQGILWVATWEGLYKYDPAEDMAVRYYYDPATRNGLPEKVVYETFIDSKSNLWVLTNSYISLFDPVSQTFDNYKIADRIAPESNIFISVIEYNSQFYIGTAQGLLQFDPSSGNKKWYRYQADKPDGLNNDVIRSLWLDDDKTEPTLWIGTAGGGLNKFNLENESFEHYTTDDGLPDNVVYGVLQDETGHLWMSTNNGLSKFDPEKETFTNFDVDDGLQSNEFNAGSYFKSNNGELFFGGLKGVNYFYPEEVELSDYEPKVVITSFAIEDKNLNPDGTKLSDMDLGSQGYEISLEHNENVFQFTFSALDFNDPDANQYQYMLEGWDKDFIQAGNKRSAIYSNVSTGTYTFRVRGSNSDGVWSPKEARLSITIFPPWWRTTLAKCFYGLLAILLALYFRRAHLNRLKLKNDLALELLQTEKLKELDEVKTRFFSNVSHEFRTPLTVILSPLDDLMKSVTNTKNLKTIEKIKANASRLLELVNQLMDLSKIQDNKFKLNLTSQPLEHFIERLLDRYRPIAEEKAIALHLNSTLGERHVHFDRDAIEKIITNLFSNALKFTSQNGNVWVDLGMINQESEQFVKISVKDDGIGISEEESTHIFDRFFQVDENNEQARGTGIGLALVKELVDLHGGEISVNSQLGRGSTFTLLLPLEIASGDIGPVLPEQHDPEVGDGILNVYSVNTDNQDQQLSNDQSEIPIVLIVEDNQDIRHLISDTLGEGYRHYHAADGNSGLSTALEIVPDLIISDIMMPGMDGYELCHQLKENVITSHIPVILLTAKASKHSKLDGLKLGADAYLTKPFDTDELRIRVEKLIQLRRRLHERYALSESGSVPDLAPGQIQDIEIEDAFLEKLNTIIRDNLKDTGYGVAELANDAGMSKSQLYRKIKALTDQSIVAYIRLVRLKVAIELLSQSDLNVSEIAYEVGFTDPAYFSRVFTKEFGDSPVSYREKAR